MIRREQAINEIGGRPAAEAAGRLAYNAAIFSFCFLQGRASFYPDVSPFGMAALCAGLFTGQNPALLFPGVFLGMAFSGKPFSALACAPVLIIWLINRGKTDGVPSLRSAVTLAASVSLAVFRCLGGGLSVADTLSIPLSAILCYLLVPMYERAAGLLLGGNFRRGDMVTSALPIGALLLGITDLHIFSRSPAALAAAFICLFAAYAGGAGSGGVTGAVLGALLSVGTPSFQPVTGALALCGVLSGALRDMGRKGCVCAFSAAVIFSFWQGGISVFAPPWLEFIAAGAIFFFLPQSVIDKITAAIPGGAKEKHCVYDYLGDMRRAAMVRLNRLLPVFSSMETAYAMKEKAPICMESVCSGCANEHICHSKYSMQTVRLFRAAARGEVNEKFKEFCLRWEEMNQQILLTRMQRECAKMIGRQIKAIGDMIGSVAKSFSKEYAPETGLTGAIGLALAEEYEPETFGVNATRENGLLTVDIACASCSGARNCERILTPLVSECAGTPMQCANYGCISRGGVCRLRFEPVENFGVVVGVSRRAPRGEKSCGDSYAFGRLDGGRFYVALSDGMGSGAEANELSQRTVALVEDYLAAGLAPALAAETANRYMSSVSRGREHYATLDVHCFSLFDGEMEYVKVGACHSYILTDGEMKVLHDSSLPLGIFDELSLSSKKERLSRGDVLIVLSDGISDCARENPDAWMDAIRAGISKHNPQAAAEYILAKSYENDCDDDKTALVVRVV